MKSITLLAALSSLPAIVLADSSGQAVDCTITNPPLPTITVYSCNPDGTPGKPPQDGSPSPNPPATGDGGLPPSEGSDESDEGEPGQPGQPQNVPATDGPASGSGNGGSSPENPAQSEPGQPDQPVNDSGSDEPSSGSADEGSSPGNPGESGEAGQPDQPSSDSDSHEPTEGGESPGSSSEDSDQPKTVPESPEVGDGNNTSGDSDEPDTVPVSEGSKSKAASILVTLLGFLPFALL